MMKHILIIIIFLFTSILYVLAECPPLPGNKEFRPSRVSPIKHLDRLQAKALAEKRALTLPATYDVLVIRVEFAQDTDSYTTGNGKFVSADIIPVQNFMDNVKNYYTENSYSQLTLNVTVTASPPYSLSKTMSVYGTDSPYYDQYETLVSDILSETSVQSVYTLSQYDHFMIYHAGAGQESDTSLNGSRAHDIWSAYVPDMGLSGAINEATFVPEMENGGADPLGVICHEYGHQLGLPDLYYSAAGGQISTIGYWSLMDAGVWLGSPQGGNPAHLDAWSKLDLGFLTPLEVQGDTSGLSFSPAETSNNTFYKIIIPTADNQTTEFFLVEYRYRASGALYDLNIPGDGILIYHIDNAIAQNAARRADNDINNGVPHRGVDIIEADGTDPENPPNQGNFGDAADVFGAGSNIFTDPGSRSYNGTQSGITLTMSASGGSGTMDLVSIALSGSMSVVKLINYPNPTTTGQTTFHVRLTRPYKNMELFLYTLSGDTVLKQKASAFSFSTAKSTDNNWVYEYMWDGNNQDSEKVASGPYLYLLRVDDDNVKTGKLAIIR